MSQKTTNELREIIRDINNEIARLTQLQGQIHQAETEITKNPALSSLLYESLALKLHNFYRTHLVSQETANLRNKSRRKQRWILVVA